MSSQVTISAKALETIADDKIRTAYSLGEFDNPPVWANPRPLSTSRTTLIGGSAES